MTEAVAELARAAGLSIPAADAALELAWKSVLATAHAEWPEVRFDEPQLAGFIGARLAGTTDLTAALATIPAADLALAAACAAQEPSAHAAFDAILGEVDAAGATTRAPKDIVDEVKQVLRMQLLVARDDKPPGITGYKGKGPLRGWVRITATRELIRHLKKAARQQPTDQPLDEALGAVDDPVLEQLKGEYRTEFATSLREAIAALGAEDRALLRQQIVDGLSIDELGAAYGVHRATAARWANRARGALVAATRARLAARLAVPVEEIDSVIRLVQSRLDASVVRYLRES
ncbi:MAG TPA: sigma-70 family RNA polymerase sigma factor [Kofleriaceae bacterium]|nr:sigma-70 family RNA polymerase sigma factor [Kofleriaceae bacterium]